MADALSPEVSQPPNTPADLTIPLLDREDDKLSKGSESSIPWLSVFNLANAAIGAGVLAFPYAFREAGVLGGLVATFIIAVVEISALCVLIRAAQRYSAPSYQELVYVAFGPLVSNLVASLIWVYLVGSCVAYLIIIGDVFQPSAQSLFGASHFLADRRIVLSAFALFVLLPLSLKKTLRSLGGFSSVAPVTLIYLAVAILAYGVSRVIDPDGIPDDVKVFGPFQGYCKAAPIVVFAFQCHIQLMPIFAELVHHRSRGIAPLDADKAAATRRQDVAIMDKVIALALGVCVVGYSLVGAFGYVAFPDVQSDVLRSFSESNRIMYVARIGMGLVAIVSYPINHFPARLIELSVLNFLRPLPSDFDSESYMRRYNILTVVFVAATLAIAISVRDLGHVYQIVGSTGGVLVIFIVPGCLLLKAAGVLPSSRRSSVSRSWSGPESRGVDTTEEVEEGGVTSRRFSESGVRVLENSSEAISDRSAVAAGSSVASDTETGASSQGSPAIRTIPSPHFTSIPHVGQRPSQESDDLDTDWSSVGKARRTGVLLWASLMLLMGCLIFGVTLWLVVKQAGDTNV